VPFDGIHTCSAAYLGFVNRLYSRTLTASGVVSFENSEAVTCPDLLDRINDYVNYIPMEPLPADNGDTVFAHEDGGSYLHLWREVILTYRQFMRQVAARTEFTGGQFEVLRQLAVSDGRSTVSELARELAVDPAAITRLVAQLTALGLTERESDARDARRRPVVLTDEGRRHMNALHAALHEREAALTTAIDATDVATAMRVLQDMRAAVESLPRRP
jgi:DNA-binding MarR family transcriptional regulator